MTKEGHSELLLPLSPRNFLEHRSANHRSKQFWDQTSLYINGAANPIGGHPYRRSKLIPLEILQVFETLKLNGVSPDAIRLHLFPFSLKDKERAWLHSLPPGCITTSNELTKSFVPTSFLRVRRQA